MRTQPSRTVEAIVHEWRGLRNLGYRIVPVKGKKACGLNWPNSRWSAAQMEGLARNNPGATNTGLICGELVGLDIDTLDPVTAEAIVAMVECLPDADKTPYRIGKAPKRLYAFRTAEPRSKRATGAYLINGQKCQIEALGVGQMFVGFGTHQDTGRPYEWFNGSPAEIALADLPTINHEDVDMLLARADEYFAAHGTLIKKASRQSSQVATAAVDSDHPWSVLNSRALANIEAWVPQLGLEGLRRYQSGYHSVASFRPTKSTTATKRGRSLNMQPSGIVDYSDGNRGYSPINLVAVCLDTPPAEAADWLCDRVGGGDDTPIVNVAGLLAQPMRRAAAISKTKTYRKALADAKRN